MNYWFVWLDASLSLRRAFDIASPIFMRYNEILGVSKRIIELFSAMQTLVDFVIQVGSFGTQDC